MNQKNGDYLNPAFLTADDLGEAIYSVNRHAKTAPNPKFLYKLKKQTIIKMLEEGKAKKIGLQFSDHPHLSFQQSDVLIQCGRYTFHIPPSKDDFQTLTHLGHLSKEVRNPSSRLSLSKAKKILMSYTGCKEQSLENPSKDNSKKKYYKPTFTRLGESYPYQNWKK